MSAPYLRVLGLSLLLSACATTQGPPGPGAAADDDAPAPLAARPHQPQPQPLPVAPPFDGPQVVFAPGSSEVPITAAPVLDNVAAKLRADPLVNVVLVGHTEDLGSAEFAVAVSGRCIRAVGQELIKRGARPSQIRMLARGYENSPRRCDKACQRRMRHVDIVLSDD